MIFSLLFFVFFEVKKQPKSTFPKVKSEPIAFPNAVIGDKWDEERLRPFSQRELNVRSFMFILF